MTTAITGPELKAIHALWRVIDAGRGDERDSRTARLDYCSQILARPVASAKDLSTDEAEKVLRAMRQETGQEWKPRGSGGKRRQVSGARGQVSGAEQTKIAELAADLWGERWAALLDARLSDRFRVAGVRWLNPYQARQIAEELLQRLAVRNLRNLKSQIQNPQSAQPPIPRTEIEAEKTRLRRKYFEPPRHKGTEKAEERSKHVEG